MYVVQHAFIHSLCELHAESNELNMATSTKKTAVPVQIPKPVKFLYGGLAG